MATVAGPLDGQALGIPISVDVRAEGAFPVGDFGDVADPGFGLSAGVAVGIFPLVGLYGSYSDIRFGGGWTGDDPADARDSGFAAGVSVAIPGWPWLDPWLGGGLLFHHLQLDGSGQGISEDLGFEVGGGVAIPIATGMRLSPAINYRHYGASIQDRPDIAVQDVTVQHLSLGLGLNIVF